MSIVRDVAARDGVDRQKTGGGELDAADRSTHVGGAPEQLLAFCAARIDARGRRRRLVGQVLLLSVVAVGCPSTRTFVAVGSSCSPCTDTNELYGQLQLIVMTTRNVALATGKHVD